MAMAMAGRPAARWQLQDGARGLGALAGLLVLLYVLQVPPWLWRASKVEQYSIWAMPRAGSGLQERLEGVIKSLSSEFYGIPFPPHVTVIGAFGAGQGLKEGEVLRRMEALCRSLKPYTIRVLDVSSGNKYFQCVYLRIVQSEEVMQVNWHARVAFGLADKSSGGSYNSSGYMPHLSLIYGHLQDSEKALAKNKVETENSDILQDMEFSVSSLALYRTDPDDLEMKSWEFIREFKLGNH